MAEPQFAPIFWPGSGSDASGLTPQAIFDDEDAFVEDAPKFADWAARRLGYPIMAVEMTDAMFYACFEEAILEYSAQINEFNIRENMLYLQGMSTGSSLTQTLVQTAPVAMIVDLAAAYGTEAGSGGTVDVRRTAIPLTGSVNEYDLQAMIGPTVNDQRIEIRRVYHTVAPAINRIFDPFAASGMGVSNMMGAFGWGGYSVETQYLLTPIYETLLRMQAIEFNDIIRRSQYSFEIANNKIRIYPTPSDVVNTPYLWLDYTVKSDKYGTGQTKKAVVSDYSNAPFTVIPYTRINSVGKRWIWKYGLALCKETLGAVRIKYTSLPIPNAEVQMDGSTLKNEAMQEKEVLWQQLRETLERAGKKSQMEAMKENELNSLEVMKLIPNLIYIG